MVGANLNKCRFLTENTSRIRNNTVGTPMYDCTHSWRRTRTHVRLQDGYGYGYGAKSDASDASEGNGSDSGMGKRSSRRNEYMGVTRCKCKVPLLEVGTVVKKVLPFPAPHAPPGTLADGLGHV